MTLCGRRAHQRYDETTGECCSRFVSSAATCLPRRRQLTCDSSGVEAVASGFGMEPIATRARRQLSPAPSCVAPASPCHETFLLLQQAGAITAPCSAACSVAVVVLGTVSLLRLNVNTGFTVQPAAEGRCVRNTRGPRPLRGSCGPLRAWSPIANPAGLLNCHRR